jgi:hypothetical protein
MQSKLIKILLGIDVYMSRTGGNSYPRLDKSFFTNVKTIVKDFDTKEQIARNIYEKIKEVQGKEILFIQEPKDIIGKDRLVEEELYPSSDMIYDILENRKDKIVIKKHQNPFNGYGKLDSLATIPNFIPTEFVLFHPWKIVIGIESYSLVMATRFDNKKVISLINMFCYENDEVQHNLYRTLKQESKDKIIFPESIGQLEEMLV